MLYMNLNLVDTSWDASHLDFNAGHQLMDIMWPLNFSYERKLK